MTEWISSPFRLQMYLTCITSPVFPDGEWMFVCVTGYHFSRGSSFCKTPSDKSVISESSLISWEKRQVGTGSLIVSKHSWQKFSCLQHRLSFTNDRQWMLLRYSVLKMPLFHPLVTHTRVSKSNETSRQNMLPLSYPQHLYRWDGYTAFIMSEVDTSRCRVTLVSPDKSAICSETDFYFPLFVTNDR